MGAAVQLLGARRKKGSVSRSRFSHCLHGGNNKHRPVRVQVQVIGHGWKDWVATEAVQYTFLQKNVAELNRKKS